MRGRRFLVSALVITTLLIGACGGDDDATDSTETTDTADSTGTTEPTGSTDTTGTTGTTEPAPAATSAAPGTSDAPDGGDGCTAERVGGSLSMGMFTESRGLDPIVMFGSGVAGGIETGAIFDRLMIWNPETGEFEPHVAESLEPNDDFTVWTLTLRSGITFGNGDPLTADAVKQSIERLKSDANKTQSREAAAIIASVTAVDELTAEFTLQQGWTNFGSLLADEAGMITNPTVVAAMAPEEFNKLPVGAGVGPYEPVRFQPGEEIVLQAKDDYWGGPVCIEELRFVWVPGGQATWDAFQNDELQMALIREPRILEEAKSAGTPAYEALQNLGEVLYLNGDEGRPTNDVRVRQAIAHAIDVEAVDQRINEGTGMPTSAILGEGSLLYSGAEGPTYDTAEATRLLDEAKAEGYDGHLQFICTSTRLDAGLAIEAQLEAVGFDVDFNGNLETADMIQKTRVERAFDISCGGISVNDASPWLRLVPKIGPGNSAEAGYESAEMTAALDVLRLAETLDEQKAAIAGIQEVWNADVPYQSLATVVEGIISAESVHGLVFSSKTVVLFHDAYIDG